MRKVAKKSMAVSAIVLTFIALIRHSSYSMNSYGLQDEEDRQTIQVKRNIRQQEKILGEEKQLRLSLHRNVSSLSSAALTVLERRPMLVTFINNGYLPMTNNWLCHTKHHPGLHQNMLILAQDEETKNQLNKQWPDLMVITIAPNNVSLEGGLKFNTVGYVRMMVRRTELLHELVQSGVPFVLFETDFVWYANPLQDFVSMAEEDDLDLVGTKSAVKDQIMCGGFIYFRNTVRTRKVWEEVLRQMHVLEQRMRTMGNDQKSPNKQNEQRSLNKLLKNRFSEVRYGLVDYNRTVTDGQWYKKSSEEKRKPFPKAVHNNFLDTTGKKIARFKKFHQWVLQKDGSCDDAKVLQLLKEYE